MKIYRVRKSQSHEAATGKAKDSEKVVKKQKIRDFTKQHAQYIKKAGEAILPKKGEIQYNNLSKWDKTRDAFFARDGETKAIFLDFDGTMARFTETPAQTLAVHGFLSSLKNLVDKGYKVAIITGRPIEGTERIHLATNQVMKEENGVLEALKRSGADSKLIDRLYIFGSHGVEQRGHETNWEVQIDPKAKDFIEPQKQLLSHLQQRIKSNNELKDLNISIEKKPLGATIHYREVGEESVRQQVKRGLSKLLSEILPEKSDNTNFTHLKDQSNENFKNFTYNSATESFEIRLNPETTDVEINKGTSVKALAEKWQVKVAIAFGDDTTDLDMQKKLTELNLTATAFVGVKHDKTPDDILTGSTLVVQGQESAVGFLKDLAQRAPNQDESQA
jgi:trehalose-6-phosphatase